MRQGPSAGLVLRGRLVLVLGSGGRIDNGVLLLDNGRAISVVAQTTGRAINLLLLIGDGQDLFGVGTLAQPLAQCVGAMGGPFVGPKPGDTGDWASIQMSSVSLQIDADGCPGCVNTCKGRVGCSRPGISCPECDGACRSTGTTS